MSTGSTVSAMIDTHPDHGGVDKQLLVAAIEACLECLQTCTTCAGACLAEDSVAELRECIRTDLACADICAATAAVLSRPGTPVAMLRAQLEACRVACATCATECEAHADHHEHCRVCGETCRRCEQACAALLESL